MRRKAPLIAVILMLGQAAWAGSIRRDHRPWLMLRDPKPHTDDAADVRRAPVSEPQPRVSAKAPSRPVAVSPAPRVEKPVVTARKAVDADDNDSDAGQRLAKQAMKYKGTRYRFGGDSKRGLDCSGLVARIYEDLKMKRVPRASHALYQSGQPVSLSELRPGDLVFFKNTYRRGISHVGIYTGHNKFIHASNRKRGVTVTPLSDPYYQLHYAGARRLY